MYNFFPTWVVITANVVVYATFAGLLGFLIWIAFALRAKRDYTVLVNTASALSLLYLLGNALKVASVGPEFARYHLGDVGFPAAVALLIFTAYNLVAWSKPVADDQLSIAAHVLKRNCLKMRITLCAVVLSVVYEVLSGVLVGQLGDRPNPGLGRFDWIDVACYLVGGGSCFFCLFGANRLLSKDVARFHEQIQGQRKVDTQHAKTDREALRKGYKKPRKRHGVR